MQVRHGLKLVTGSTVIAASLATAIPFLKVEEGLVTHTYNDSVGVQTWCYGDTGPVPSWEMTAQSCSDQLTKRVIEMCTPVLEAIKVPFNRNQGAAICSWTYNVGTYAALKSTWLKQINAGDFTGNGLLAWKYAGGKDCTIRSNNCYGMWTRRLKEHKLFNTPVEKEWEILDSVRFYLQ